MRGRKWWFAAEIALVVLLVVAVNVVAVKLSERYPLSLDLTKDSRYALSDETKALIKSLDRDVDIFVLAAEDSYATSTYTEYAAELLKQYPKYGRVSVTYVDFALDPTFAARYPELALPENGLLVASESRAEALETADLFEYSYGAANEIQVTSVAEAKLAEAIASVASDSRMKALVLTGNGAQPVEGLRELLVTNNFDVQEAPLAMGAFDLGADVAILAAPTSDLTAEQISSIEAFLEGGGEYGKSLFYAADVTQPALPNLEALLREWGVAVDDGAVFETSPERTYQSQPFFATVEMAGGALAAEFADEPAPIIAPMARPLTVRFRFQEGYATEALLQFSETSGVRPSDAPQGFTAKDSARSGPIPALVKSTLSVKNRETGEERTSSVYACGLVSLLDGKVLSGNAFLNRRYLLKLFGELGEGPDIANLVGTKLTGEAVSLNTSTANALGVALAIALPAALFVAGVVYFLRRRRL